MRATLKYALLRAVAFIAPFAVLRLAQVPWYLSLIIALVFAFCVSFIFFSKAKQASLAELAALRSRGKADDESAEDAATDATPSPVEPRSDDNEDKAEARSDSRDDVDPEVDGAASDLDADEDDDARNEPAADSEGSKPDSR